MIGQTLNEYLAEARSNKKQRVDTDHYQIIRNNKAYHALFMDAWHDKEKKELGVNAVVFTSPIGVRRDFKFRTDSVAVHYYEELCDTVGTNGNPCELIGKAVILHFEKNGDFQNVRVDGLISREELQEALAEMEEDEEERPRNKNRSSKTSKVRNQNTHKKKNTGKEADDFDEEAEREDDFDEEDELDEDLADFD